MDRPGAATIDFVVGVGLDDLPADVRARVACLLRDFVAVSLAGRKTLTAHIAAEHSCAEHAGDAATVLVDGSRASAAGAAWANGVLANALDFDDGHRLVKGHPGANVIPAALAAAEAVGATRDDFLAAVAVGYEIAIRAGIHLHVRSTDYHASGAWGALGAAAAAARLLGLDRARAEHAFGLAEYHAPIAPVMRSVQDPAMTKDACGFGAFLGISSALLAKRGFTALTSRFLSDGASADLGERWHVLDVYVKEFPCCRWSHPAISAALGLRRSGLDRDRIAHVRVETFSAAAALARRPPTTTEEAQYSLVWPVAAALVHGAFGVDHVLAPFLDDRAVHDLATRIEVEVDAALDAQFPERRLSQVTIESTDQDAFCSGVTEARGEPDDPAWTEIVEAKFGAFATAVDLAGLPPVLARALEIARAPS